MQFAIKLRRLGDELKLAPVSKVRLLESTRGVYDYGVARDVVLMLSLMLMPVVVVVVVVVWSQRQRSHFVAVCSDLATASRPLSMYSKSVATSGRPQTAYGGTHRCSSKFDAETIQQEESFVVLFFFTGAINTFAQT